MYKRQIEEDAHAIRLVNHDVNTIHHQEITDNLLIHHLPVETKHTTELCIRDRTKEQAKLIFRFNHTMPMTEEQDEY